MANLWNAIANELRQVADLTEDNTVSNDYVLYRLDCLTERIILLEATTEADLVPAVLQNLDEAARRLYDSANPNGLVGRPRQLIPIEFMESLLLSGFTVPDIARLMGVSERTIHRRMAENGMRVSDLLNNMSDEELDAVVGEILCYYPNTGYKMMMGHLNARGIRIQRSRVQEAMVRVDPAGVYMRNFQLQTVRRRRYSVPSPNSLWHIDGNHKLIRWRFVVHGGIDGFSRLIVYLKAATNNRASTVLESFLQAINEYGIPSRVRSDKGGENIQVAHFMVSRRGQERNSHITGRSTHNQRIERLWRDVYGGVLDLFYTTFSNMESEGLLNPDNDLHLFALHWTFLHQLNRHLYLFKEGWNNHRLRTEGNRSPQELWSQNQREGQDLNQVDQDYGIDWQGPNGHHPEGVTLPEVQLARPLTEEELQRLPEPSGGFSSVLNVYTGAIDALNDIFDGI
ncbi:uncharacterized protein LOC110368072 [Fundulus heteroclitus]|uniref:uncharacterized protein LOC110368072 n=1 Tax=Fundulus heteroclitus TaxID=8078 RepID=UPI00165BDF90|nr:uncharacterized protein LOC110368072 [Fundulus heteroclitus]